MTTIIEVEKLALDLPETGISLEQLDQQIARRRS